MILIFPDIHGRTFWQQAVSDVLHEIIVPDDYVFLGDYLDPYTSQVAQAEAIINFNKLLALWQFMPHQELAEDYDKGHMLIGNHDFKYMNDTFARRAGGDKTMRSFYYQVKGIFTDLHDLLHLAYETTVNGRRFLFTHAGVNRDWYARHADLIGELTADNLNKLPDTKEGVEALCDIGWRRGGPCDTGGMLWADVDDNDDNPDGIDYQIFSHSQQPKDPIINDRFAMLDCRRTFVLDDEGKVVDYEDYMQQQGLAQQRQPVKPYEPWAPYLR